MSPPIKVELRGHDPSWQDSAAAEARTLVGCNRAMPDHRLHDVGSTAVPGIHAKPILDLIPVARRLSELDACRGKFEVLGYQWWGELGLPGRRYCTRSHPATGVRLSQLHCYPDGSAEIVRHLAFRDYLREFSGIAAEYDGETAHCRDRYPHDSHAYGDCKASWIEKAEADALRWYQTR